MKYCTDEIIYCPNCGGSSKDFGIKDNKVTIMIPEYWNTERDSRFFDVDSCMVPELKYLWDNNVRTIECCCGHGTTAGYIAVDRESITIMEMLKYKHHRLKINRTDLFERK